MNVPRVSVVVPTHNRARLLPRMLTSVLGQDLEDIEVIVVDDGSRDETPGVLAAWPDPRLRVVRHERPTGVSQARNDGHDAARARWVAWCDDDDLWSPEKLRLQLAALEASPESRWCNSGVANLDEDLELLSVSSCPDPQDIGRQSLYRNPVKGGGSGVMAERDLVLRLGGFDTELSTFADWHMWARLALAAPIAVVDLPLVGYVRHAGGMSNERANLPRELEQLRTKFTRLAAEAGLATMLDVSAVADWMFSRQVSGGSRLGAGLLPLQLARQGAMPPVTALLKAVIGVAVPSALRRRWMRRESEDTDQHHVAYALAWLEAFQRDGPDATAIPDRLGTAARDEPVEGIEPA